MTAAPRRGRGSPVSAGPRVGLYGLLGSGNIGNEGSAQSVLDYLRRDHPDAVIDAMCGGPAEVTARYGIPAVSMHRSSSDAESARSVLAVLRKTVGKLVDGVWVAAWVRRHDVVIMPGMGAFEATLPLRAWASPYHLFVLCLFGRLFGTKVALVSVGANVVRARATRRLLAAAARRAHYVSYRDRYSQDSMREMGLAARGDDVYTDLVFALPTPTAAESPSNTVGVGVLDYHGGNDDRPRADRLNAAYLSAVTRLVRRLIDDGRTVRLFTGDRVDDVVVETIRADLHRTRPDVDPARVQCDPVGSLQELMEQMLTVDAVVATRYHNVLCALKLAKPTVSVGYGIKNDVLMAASGLGEFCQHADSIDVERLLEQLAEVEARRAELRPGMIARIDHDRRLLAEQFTVLDAVLFARPRSRGSAPVHSTVPQART